jgi:2-polyprenyl-3-methyl-5-hydroxy-6-metoxy-1,4-benzoquinol methylase
MDLSHVGGHLNMTHTDEGALNLLKNWQVTSMLDVGCSVGGQVKLACDMGIDAYGIDGDYSLLQAGSLLIPERIFFCDFTKSHVEFPFQFDAVWCVEVAEHIEEAYTLNLIKTISCNLKQYGILVFTANSGPGIHHVNIKPVEWWMNLLSESGFIYEKSLTEYLKALSTMSREFIQETGMVFSKIKGLK